MISFANILGLFALAGILVPLIVHLLSKRTKNTIAFGSLKFLEDTETKTLRSIQLNDIWLLLLRMLIVVLLAFIVADLLLEGQEQKSEVKYLVDPVYRDNLAIKYLSDTTAPGSLFWLSNGYPSFSDPVEKTQSADFYQKLPAEWEKDSLIVISPFFYKDLIGPLSIESGFNRWISLPVDERKYSLSQIKKGDSAINIEASESESGLFVDYSIADSGEKKQMFYFFQDYLPAEGQKIIQSALSAIDQNSWITLEETKKIEESDLIIDTTFTPGFENKKIVVLGDPVTQQSEIINKNLMIISKQIDKESALVSSLPVHLERFIAAGLLDYRNDIRSAPVSEYFISTRKFNGRLNTEKQSADSLLWWIALVLLLTERIIVAWRTI